MKKGKRGALCRARIRETWANKILRHERTRQAETIRRLQDKPSGWDHVVEVQARMIVERDEMINQLTNQLAATGEELRRAEEQALHFERQMLDCRPIFSLGQHGQLCLVPSPQMELGEKEAV